MLTACAARAIGVDAEVIRVDIDMNLIRELRHDVAGDKRSLTLARGIEGRDAHQTVHTVFAPQSSVGIFAVNLNGHGLDTCDIAVEIIENLD